MTTARRIGLLVEPHGFIRHQAAGFVGWHRTHEDGRKQLLHVFFWSNPKHAAAQGIPHAYIVVCPAIDAVRLPDEDGFYVEEDGRFTVVTKDRSGAPVVWADAAAEFEHTYLEIFNAPLPRGRQLLEDLRQIRAL